MDVNSKINWTPGMELTAEAFAGMTDHWEVRQRLAMRAALGSNRMGLVPGAPFNCRGLFVKNRFEADHFQCMALLPSGRIVNADEDLLVTIPMLFGDRYYLTIGFSDDQTEFEKDGVAFVRPHYVYAINTIEEIENGDLFPLVRFKVNEGVFSVDSDFIIPCLLLASNPRFKEYIERYVEKLMALSAHKSMADGEGKRAILRYVFMLKNYNLQNSMQDFILLTQEIAQAIDYYIVTPNREQPLTIPMPSQADIQFWLQWLDDYLAGAAVILDGVVLDDTTIDYEALLAQAKKELYERLHPELIEKLLADMREDLKAEIKQQTETITEYINGTVKPELLNLLTTEMDSRTDRMNEMLKEKFDELGKQLHNTLYEKLYFELFENLFNALYVPEPEEKDFMPQI